MSTDRDDALFMAQGLGRTDHDQRMVDLMKRVVEFNPVLTIDERRLSLLAPRTVLSLAETTFIFSRPSPMITNAKHPLTASIKLGQFGPKSLPNLRPFQRIHSFGAKRGKEPIMWHLFAY
jgi:hypothetical protein